ncbi:MAG: sodium:calcium antiporter, partial [Candidatus Omnitrophica bacterium]|nr:sodium:calcium antiporter [Candidatus Omnitrophota bacterium]
PVAGVALGGTFVGSLLIAITTSLPEMAVALSAVKLGFLDMALANIFGSNMFNMLIIPVIDLSLGKKIILSCVSSMHLFTIIFVLISTGLVTAGLVYRTKKKMPALAWDTIGILFVYVAANIVNFYLR